MFRSRFVPSSSGNEVEAAGFSRMFVLKFIVIVMRKS